MHRLTTVSRLTNKHNVITLTLNANIARHCYRIKKTAFLTSRSLNAW